MALTVKYKLWRQQFYSRVIPNEGLADLVLIKLHFMYLTHIWLADGDSLICCIVTIGRQFSKMFFTFFL